MKARLYVQASVQDGRTVLGTTFFSAPFKLADISEKGSRHCRAMVMNASPGVLDGDAYEIQIELAENASLVLETQAFQRVFAMKGSAVQKMEVHMAEKSSFSFLPHPSVPHKDAHFTADNHIHMQTGCRLVWGEVLTPGRMLGRENFTFRHYQSKTAIYLQGKLVVKDNLLVRPEQVPPLSVGNLEGFTHQASLLFLAPDGWEPEYASLLRDELDNMKGVEWGLSRLPVPGLAVRMVGNKAEPLFQCLRQLGQLVGVKTENKGIHAA